MAQRILAAIEQKELRWHPYRICLRHELNKYGVIKIVSFSEWLIPQCKNARFLTNLVTADEAAFVLNGKVNTWNNKE